MRCSSPAVPWCCVVISLAIPVIREYEMVHDITMVRPTDYKVTLRNHPLELPNAHVQYFSILANF